MQEYFKKVKDYWHHQEGWKWNNMDGKLPNHVKDEPAVVKGV